MHFFISFVIQLQDLLLFLVLQIATEHLTITGLLSIVDEFVVLILYEFARLIGVWVFVGGEGDAVGEVGELAVDHISDRLGVLLVVLFLLTLLTPFLHYRLCLVVVLREVLLTFLVFLLHLAISDLQVLVVLLLLIVLRVILRRELLVFHLGRGVGLGLLRQVAWHIVDPFAVVADHSKRWRAGSFSVIAALGYED